MVEPAETIGRRQRNKLEKRKRISAAARELFHRQGFAETSTAQIAKAAGVAEGTLFLYVGRKEDLLVLAFVDELDEAVRAAFAALDDSAGFTARIVGYFCCILAYHEADMAIAKLFLREVGVLRDPHRDYGFGQIPMMESLEAIVTRAQQRGEIDPALAAPDLAQLCFALYWGALRDWANEALTSEEFAVTLNRMVNLAVRGIALR